MPQQDDKAKDLTTSLQRGFEQQDTHLRGLVIFAVCFIAGVASCVLIAKVCLNLIARDHREADMPRSAVNAPPTDLHGPPLEPSMAHDLTPLQDYQKLRDEERQTFANLGWQIDAEHDRVSMPAALVEAVRTREQGRPEHDPAAYRTVGVASVSGAGAATQPATTRVVTPAPGVDEGGGR